MDNNYIQNIKPYSRITIPVVHIGNVEIGGNKKIAVQSMTNTNTNSIEESIAQCIRVFDAGGDYVRLTAQGIKEAEALAGIKKGLISKGYNHPLVADIHFNPKAAIIAAQFVEKVRINPGNYVTLSSLTKTEYTEEEYQAELDKIKENILPLLEVCKKHKTAIRIGVNHGSLSQRIVSKYGDTPLGMVMSMMEFLHICKEAEFTNIVCSIKASNTRIMVYATRLLAQKMAEENCLFPIHLGVTEAGAGEDGRIKSAVGIGSLLLDGIGDTIRVSLTEAPELEIPVCSEIVSYRDEIFKKTSNFNEIDDVRINPFNYSKIISNKVGTIGGDSLPIVVSNENILQADWEFQCDSVLKNTKTSESYIVYTLDEYKNKQISSPCIIKIGETDIDLISQSNIHDNVIFMFLYSGIHITYFIRKLYSVLKQINQIQPIILQLQNDYKSIETSQIRFAMDIGSLFIDGFCDGIFLENKNIDSNDLVNLSFSILQATRSRISKTEFISCPSCGRTLFNIEQALHDVKSKTDHLKGLKIAVMGCVVNGPGEMADADYGYVGAGRGMVNLYRKQDLVRKSIPENNAVQTLIDLIKEQGDWKDK